MIDVAVEVVAAAVVTVGANFFCIIDLIILLISGYLYENNWYKQNKIMGDYLKLCKNQEEYDNLSAVYPVTHLINDLEVKFDERFVAFYDVTSTNEPTILLGGKPKQGSPLDMSVIKRMEIDGVIVDRNVSAYTFSEIGTHVVKLEFKYNTLLTYNIFNTVPNLKGAIVRPYSIKTIGNGAFSECTKITSIGVVGSVADIIIGGEVDYLGGEAFSYCTSLSSVSLPDSIVGVGNSCFKGCNNLTEIRIPKNVANIYNYAFQNCSKLSYIICSPTIPPTLYGTSTFANTNNCPIYVPQESVNAYKTAKYWSSYSNRIFPIS